MAAITFGTYVMSDPANILTVEKAFVCLTLFDIIRMPLVMFPLVFVYVIEVNEHCEIGGLRTSLSASLLPTWNAAPIICTYN